MRRKNLTAVVRTGFQVNVVVAAQVAGGAVLNIGRSFQAIVGTAHAALGLGDFTLRDGHG